MDSDSSSVFQVPCGHLSGLFIVSGGLPGQRSDLCRRMFSPLHVDSWLWKSCHHSWTLDGHFWWVFEVKVLVAQLCPTLGDPMNCSPPGSSVPGISQARILEWVAISSSRLSSQPRDWTQVSYIAGRWFFLFLFFTIWATREAPDECLPAEFLPYRAHPKVLPIFKVSYLLKFTSASITDSPFGWYTVKFLQVLTLGSLSAVFLQDLIHSHSLI